MRIIKIELDKIKFDKKEYSDSLKKSIIRIGLSFPIKVEIKEDGYYCIDGHKRLSVLNQLTDDRFKTVNVIIVNNGNVRSNDCWRDRNHH